MFIVPDAWVVYDGAGIMTCYPPKTDEDPKNLVKSQTEPEEDWEVIEVDVIKANLRKNLIMKDQNNFC